MFTNLIESNSHTREFKRRTSFFLVTIAAYCLVLFAAVVAGIVTYDATVEAANNDLTLMDWIPPVKPPTTTPPQGPRPVRPVSRPNAPVDQHITVPERTQAISPPNDPNKIPDTIGTKGSDTPPVEGPVVISKRNADPPTTPIENGGACATCPPQTATVVEPKPQPTPAPRPATQTVGSRILASKAITLPQPPYPQIAKQARIQGAVNVQILIDEHGKVISAHAVSGSAMLTAAAEQAAMRARFTPTTLNDQPVKVQGVITYNFILQ